MAATNFSAIMRDGTDLILFSVDPTYSGRLATGRIPTTYIRSATSARDKNGGRVLVCIGGGGRSAAFPTVAASAALRQSLIHDLITYCKQHKLDGVDYNWESPANAEEAKHFGILLSNTKKMFRPNPHANHNNMVLTLT